MIGPLQRATRRFALAGALVVLACRPGDELRFVPSPPAVLGARSAIVFLQDPADASLTDAYALTLDARGLLAAPFVRVLDSGDKPTPAVTQVFVLYYALELSSLGVDAGPLLASTGEPRACEITTPLAVWAHLSESAGWDANATPSSAMLAHLQAQVPPECALPDRCAKLDIASYSIGEGANVDVLIALGPRRALVGSSQGHFSIATPEGLEPFAPLDGQLSASGYCAPGGQCWFGGRSSNIVHGPLEGPYESFTLSGEPRWVGAISGQEQADGTLELLFITLAGHMVQGAPVLTVYRLDETRTGTTPLAIYSADVNRVIENHANIVWTEPRHAFINYGGNTLVEVENGSAHEIPVGEPDPLFDNDVQSVAFHPEHGLLIGGTSGRLYLRAVGQQRFSLVPDVQAVRSVEAAHVYRTGFVFGSLSGFVRQFHPGGRVCEQELVGNADVEKMALAGDALLVSGGVLNTDATNFVTWYVDRP